jgi:hypothetical protein
MSLKARLKRLEAQVEWLEFDGMLRVCELKLELIDKKRQIADHLAANPEAAALFAAAGITSIRPTPRPSPPPPPRQVLPPPASPEPPPPLESVPPAETIPQPVRETPGHMQLSPVTRRLRDSPGNRDDSNRPEENYYGYHADF